MTMKTIISLKIVSPSQAIIPTNVEDLLMIQFLMKIILLNKLDYNVLKLCKNKIPLQYNLLSLLKGHLAYFNIHDTRIKKTQKFSMKEVFSNNITLSLSLGIKYYYTFFYLNHCFTIHNLVALVSLYI